MNIKLTKIFSLLFIFIALLTFSTNLFASDGQVKFTFYDEDTLDVLDDNVLIRDVTNNVAYYADGSGVFESDLATLNWENRYINAYYERVVDGITTHTRRNLQFYWDADQNFDWSVALLPVGVGSNIEFEVRDTNNDLWDNKFVQFNSSLFKWNETQPAGDNDFIWYSSAMSADGQKIIVGIGLDYGGTSGRLYLSTNGGDSWSEVQPAGNNNRSWAALAMSADGQKIIAGAFNSRLYISNDGGSSWSEIQVFGNNDKRYMSASMSADGQKIMFVVDNDGVYLSTNGGVSFSNQTPSSSSSRWAVCQISKNGNFLIAGIGGAFDGRLYFSTNNGSNWYELQPAGNSNRRYRTISMSDDGQKIIVGTNERLYISNNSGNSWSEVQPAGNFNINWITTSMSDDGQKIIAGSSTRLYISNEGGSSWSEVQPAGNFNFAWRTTSISSDGDVILAGNIRLYLESKYNVITSSNRTSSEGLFTSYLKTDGDYNATLYNSTGVEGDTYTKSTVELFKPKDEKIGDDISPYDVEVGGLLNYTLSNQTSASVSFNIFAGVINNFYNFRVVDYNAIVSDQVYVPRNYVVAIPFGTDYQSLYTLQPYLLKKEDAIVPKVYTVDILGNSIDGVQILIIKNINGTLTLVEAGETLAGGTMSFVAYPLDTYIIQAYYQGELKAQGTIVPRTSADVYTITIDILPEKPLQDYFNFGVNWKTTKSRFNITNEDIVVLFGAKVNQAIVDDYTVTLEKNGVVLSTATVPYTTFTTDANVTFNRNLLTPQDVGQTLVVRVTANLVDGTKISRTRQVYVSTGGFDPLGSLQKVPSELGQPLSIIIAFLTVGLLIGFLVTTGFVRDPIKLGYFAIFLLAPFVMLGFFDVGIKVLGVDVGKFFYSVSVIVTLYLAMRELR